MARLQVKRHCPLWHSQSLSISLSSYSLLPIHLCVCVLVSYHNLCADQILLICNRLPGKTSGKVLEQSERERENMCVTYLSLTLSLAIVDVMSFGSICQRLAGLK